MNNSKVLVIEGIVYNKPTSVQDFIEARLGDARRNAKRKKLDYSISYSDILELYYKQSGKCAISSVLLTSNVSGYKLHNLSIDRKDNTKGYLKDNIHLVCVIANKMKSNFEYLEFINMCKSIANSN